MTQNKIHLLLIIVLAIFSCQSVDKASKPDIILSEDCMTDIFTEIAFIKAAKISYKKILDDENVNPEAYILRKYGIDSIVFTENNIWYSKQLETYRKILTKVKNNLESSRIKYEKIKKEEDSIKNINDSIELSKVNKLPLNIDLLKKMSDEETDIDHTQ